MKQSNSQSGFTIIEMLVTIILFAILVPTIVGFINTISSLNDRAKDTAVVNSLVENKIESLRSAGFRTIDTGSTDFSTELPSILSNPKSASYNVTEISPSVKQIDITVNHTTAGGLNTLTYRTYVGEIGVGQY